MEMGRAIQLSLLERMALVNNLGHVHFVLNNDMYSQGCFQNLMHLLDLVQETSNKNNQMSINEQNSTTVSRTMLSPSFSSPMILFQQRWSNLPISSLLTTT